MSKAIQLTRGKITLVSDHRFDYLNQWKWHAKKDNSGIWYAGRVKNGRCILMHRVITNAPDGMLVDHWDLDGLNNQDHNLRICTRTQNQANKRSSNASGYKGIHKHGRGWQVRIEKSGKLVFCETHSTPEEAARAYDRGALEYFGEFAYLNFPTKQNI